MNRVVTIGEIMGRLCTPHYGRFRQSMPGTLEFTFGGAEASISALVVQLGGKASYITALPDNPIGQACVANLKSMDVETAHIVMQGDSRLGLYFVEQGANLRAGQVIYDRSDSAFAVTPPEAYDWDAIFENASWLAISGITPAISRIAYEVACAAIDHAVDRGVKVALDMNFRSKLWRWDPKYLPQELASKVMGELVPKANLLITGRGDAVSTLAFDETLSDEQLCQSISDRYGSLSFVALTRRSGDSANQQSFAASLFDPEQRQLFHAPEESSHEITHVVDRIGSGDAFAGALLFALMNPGRYQPQQAIELAAAACALAHSIEGDFSHLTLEEIESLAAGDAAGRLRR